MEIKVASGDITKQDVGAVVVNLFEGVTSPGGGTGAVDQALGGAITQLIEDGETKGKRGEITVIHTLGMMPPSRVLVAGLGKSSDFTTDSVRTVMGKVCRHLRRIGVETVATIAHGAGIGGMDAHASGQAIAEGSILGAYRFDKYRAKKDGDGKNIRELTIVEFDAGKVEALEKGVADGKVIADAVNLCRGMVSEPPNYMTPTRMAEMALEIATEQGLEIQVLERPQMEELGMGALLGVAKGSDEPPKFIVLLYNGDPDDKDNSLGLLGKGITFDSGGLSLKPSKGMATMGGDMAGGAAVIAVMKAVGHFKPKINVTAIVAATENLPGGHAQRPGDVVRAMNGKTIEIDNTDAEGRLVLADAVAYGRSVGLSRIVDVATLTGAIDVALGKFATGVFGNDQDFTDQVIAAGKEVDERLWQMPTYDDYKGQYKSRVADIKNTGGRSAGAITGAMIIGEFAEGASWVHLDIAASSGAFRDAARDEGYNPKGPTGVPVRTLIALVRDLAKA